MVYHIFPPVPPLLLAIVPILWILFIVVKVKILKSFTKPIDNDADL